MKFVELSEETFQRFYLNRTFMSGMDILIEPRGFLKDLLWKIFLRKKNPFTSFPKFGPMKFVELSEEQKIKHF